MLLFARSPLASILAACLCTYASVWIEVVVENYTWAPGPGLNFDMAWLLNQGRREKIEFIICVYSGWGHGRTYFLLAEMSEPWLAWMEPVCAAIYPSVFSAKVCYGLSGLNIGQATMKSSVALDIWSKCKMYSAKWREWGVILIYFFKKLKQMGNIIGWYPKLTPFSLVLWRFRSNVNFCKCIVYLFYTHLAWNYS